MSEYYIKQIFELNKGKNKKAKINTFGCQMNAHDSEKLSDMILKMGYEITNDNDADLVLFNTCCVRENPEDKLFGNLGYFKNKKKNNPDLKIILCGCMMQQKHIIDKLRSSYNFVDVVFGTFNFHKLPELLYNNIMSNSQIIDIWDEAKEFEENFSLTRKFPFKASVNIIYGCNNFCSYCIVPYVRGRERSRNFNDIVDEVKYLVDDGVKEIMLLGQNVNSYGLDLKNGENFAKLLKEINKIDGLERIRFMTSHPKDLSDELIFTMRDCRKICHHLHLPVQSGSNRILKLMNRKYTREYYLKLVEKIKKNIPDIALTTDIIVGFPQETNEDFEDTLSLVKEVAFDNAFTFIYSKRERTKAAKMPEQIPSEIVKERFEKLLDVLNNIVGKKNERYLGSTQKILVEEYDNNKLTGRNENNILVHFNGKKNLLGNLVDVKIINCKPFYLVAERI
jgi:tRNA-N(6)-(isopentenyl)adenosine-37 thiotransferase enzyme MiaB/MiaB-like tRNA modifying enzyme